MCYILALKPKHQFTEAQLSNAHNYSKEGAGFAYVKDGQLKIRKGFQSFDSFYTAYSKIDVGCPRLIHFSSIKQINHRNRVNNHPFEVIKEELCFAQHGVIFGITATEESTEARLLFKDVIKPVFNNKTYKYVRNSYVRWLLDEAIGSTNKMVFLDKDGLFTIINPQDGFFDRDNEVWFSSKAHEWAKIVNVTTGNLTANNSFAAKGSDETYDVWLSRIYKGYIEKKKTGEEGKKEENTNNTNIPIDNFSNTVFKINDKVICMDPPNFGNLVKGAVYVIEDICEYGEIENETHKQFIKVNGNKCEDDPFYWLVASRFKKVEIEVLEVKEEKKQEEVSYVGDFSLDDKIRCINDNDAPGLITKNKIYDIMAINKDSVFIRDDRNNTCWFYKDCFVKVNINKIDENANI